MASTEVAVGAIIEGLGAFTSAQRDALAPQLRPLIKNVVGREVGAIRPANALITEAR